MSNAHILLVEDDSNDADLAMLLLREIHQGASIRHVADGAQALDYLIHRGEFARLPAPLPTLVLLDLKMPRVDGFEVLEQLRTMPGQPLHRIVVLSSSAHDRDVQRAYELGASGYVVKSIDFDTYRSTLRAIWDFWAVVNLPPHPAAPPSPEIAAAA